MKVLVKEPDVTILREGDDYVIQERSVIVPARLSDRAATLLEIARRKERDE